MALPYKPNPSAPPALPYPEESIAVAHAIESATIGVVEATNAQPNPPPRSARAIKELKLPPGLQEAILLSAEETAVRYWILDNSGSMSTPDGHLLVQKPSGSMKSVQCTRWAELGVALRWHGQAAMALGARTEFRLLNDPTNCSCRMLVLGEDNEVFDNDRSSGLQQLERMIESSPTAGTPLCAALKEVRLDLETRAPELRASGQSATVIVASDGEASDGDVGQALAPFVNLPCSVIVRLCTDNDRVIAYWNRIDEDLELKLDVLDDFKGEGQEVRHTNPWLAYSLALHRVREWGVSSSLFDLIDERLLSSTEAVEFMKLILGRDRVASLTHPDVDSKKFQREMKILLQEVGPVFDGSTETLMPWVDLKIFRRLVLKKGGSGCLLM